MIEATKKLREPAGFALVAYGAVALLFSIIDLLFSESAGQGAANVGISSIAEFQKFLSPLLAVLLLVAVLLVNGFGPIEGRTRQAKVVTLVALVDFAVALLFGVISLFSTFGSDAPGRDNIEQFFVNLAGGAVVGAAAWFTWLVYQGHMPVKPTGWQGGPPPGYQPQQQPWGQQPPQGYQAPPPGGYGFPQQPQQPGPPPQTQFFPPATGQPPQPPVPPAGGEPGNAGQTQVFPSVSEPPTTSAEPPSGEQPWSPGGPWSPQG
jgi:hypothetical protein